MAYAKRYAGGFVDKPTLTTGVDAPFLNAVEVALLKLQSVDPSADGQVLQWDNVNSRYGPALLLNKNVDPAAAIDKSKLNLAGQIGNADIAGGAAIVRSKLNFGAGLVDADISASAAIAATKLAVPYTSYTPTWAATGTAPSFGNSVVTTRWAQVGKLVHFYGRIVFGSSASFGTGAFVFTLPVFSALVPGVLRGFGTVDMLDSSSNARVLCIAETTTTSTFYIVYSATYLGAGALVGQLAPWTWAVSDEISFNLVYEAA